MQLWFDSQALFETKRQLRSDIDLFASTAREYGRVVQLQSKVIEDMRESMVGIAVAYGRWEEGSEHPKPDSWIESAWAELLFQIDPTETSMGTNSAFYDKDELLNPDREGAPEYMAKYADEKHLGVGAPDND